MEGNKLLFDNGYSIDKNGYISLISLKNTKLSEEENYKRIIILLLGLINE